MCLYGNTLSFLLDKYWEVKWMVGSVYFRCRKLLVFQSACVLHSHLQCIRVPFAAQAIDLLLILAMLIDVEEYK